jgi:hypothetical protein
MPKFIVALFAETTINSEEFEIEADSEAEARELAVEKAQNGDVAWETDDCEGNRKDDTIAVNYITKVED